MTHAFALAEKICKPCQDYKAPDHCLLLDHCLQDIHAAQTLFCKRSNLHQPNLEVVNVWFNRLYSFYMKVKQPSD